MQQKSMCRNGNNGKKRLYNGGIFTYGNVMGRNYFVFSERERLLRDDGESLKEGFDWRCVDVLSG